MPSKASVATVDNGSLFELIKQQVKRTKPVKVQRKSAPAPSVIEDDDADVPDWCARAPSQPILEYTDRDGHRRRQHVTAHRSAQDQDVVIRLTINEIFQDDGSDIQLHILEAATGLTLERWAVWRDSGYLDCRLINRTSRETA